MPPFWMARRVPFSTTEYPLVSDPIFTSLYCAPSCSCNETGAWALAVEQGNDETVRNTITGIRRPNFSDIRTLPISSSWKSHHQRTQAINRHSMDFSIKKSFTRDA